MKRKQEELEKRPGEWMGSRKKSENKGENNAQREACRKMNTGV